MPLYAAYLALFYSPDITDDDYFVVAKRWNIRLSLVLLAALAVIFARQLPPLVAANLIASRGVRVLRVQGRLRAVGAAVLLPVLPGVPGVLAAPAAAGAAALDCGWRAQPECSRRSRTSPRPALLPFVAVFVGVFVVVAWIRTARHGTSSLLRDAAVPVVVVVAFLAVLSPYLVNSKRTFGSYFYNVNTTFYAWYDNWAQASVGTIRHGDGVGWPEHAGRSDSVRGEILAVPYHRADRGAGRRAGSRTWWCAHIARTGISSTSRGTSRCWPSSFCPTPRPSPVSSAAMLPLVAFLVLYGISHLLLIAFYEPISGTGTYEISDRPPDAIFLCRVTLSRASRGRRTTKWTIGRLSGGRPAPARAHQRAAGARRGLLDLAARDDDLRRVLAVVRPL